MILSPTDLISKNVVTPSEFSKVCQNGIDLSLKEDLILEPMTHKNILLNEQISLPADMYATLHIRSTYSRQGIFLSSGLWDSGFVGNLGCTLYNFSKSSIVIAKGERICQVVCHEAVSASLYEGRWMNT